jgi:hypothetical protein
MQKNTKKHIGSFFMPIDNGINQEFLALKVIVNSKSYLLILYFLIADFERFLFYRTINTLSKIRHILP